MAILVIGLSVLVLVFFPALRCTVSHPLKVLWYAPKDVFFYVVHRRWNECSFGELVAYTGLFGKGKTLSVVHRIVGAYRRYDGKKVWCPDRKQFVTQKVKVLSNVALSIPYENLVSLAQVIRCAELNQEEDKEKGTLTVTLVLGDEFSVQMNSRNFKTNIDPLFLNTLLTCRHYRISLFYTAQRFGHVDALLRQVTSNVVVCDKFWRLQALNTFNAWELENAANPALIKPLRRTCWFVSDKAYAAYDTFACVGNLAKSVKEGGHAQRGTDPCFAVQPIP